MCLPDSPDSSLCSVGHTNLAENVLHVFLHRFVTNVKFDRNLLVGQAFGELNQNLTLPLCQRRINFNFRSSQIAEAGESTQFLPTPYQFALGGLPNRLDQLGKCLGLAESGRFNGTVACRDGTTFRANGASGEPVFDHRASPGDQP